MRPLRLPSLCLFELKLPFLLSYIRELIVNQSTASEPIYYRTYSYITYGNLAKHLILLDCWHKLT